MKKKCICIIKFEKIQKSISKLSEIEAYAARPERILSSEIAAQPKEIKQREIKQDSGVGKGQGFFTPSQPLLEASALTPTRLPDAPRPHHICNIL